MPFNVIIGNSIISIIVQAMPFNVIGNNNIVTLEAIESGGVTLLCNIYHPFQLV